MTWQALVGSKEQQYRDGPSPWDFILHCLFVCFFVSSWSFETVARRDRSFDRRDVEGAPTISTSHHFDSPPKRQMPAGSYFIETPRFSVRSNDSTF